ncbi:MAG TPA: PH domain-containing protein [Alphaproteobacteria bacterium]|nr:PH domain-containing protein [Alphaproteobacteria bacterium]
MGAEMGYVERVLQPGETIRHTSRIHRVVYLPGLLLCLIAVIGLAYTAKNGANQAILVLFAVIGGAGLVSLASAWFRRWTTEIAVTDRRVIYKRGFIRRHTIEMNMDKIESVDVDQTILGRILGYGTVTVRGTGAGLEPLQRIDSPLELRNSVTAR